MMNDEWWEIDEPYLHPTYYLEVPSTIPYYDLRYEPTYPCPRVVQTWRSAFVFYKYLFDTE
jgi:hypothetical protein